MTAGIVVGDDPSNGTLALRADQQVWSASQRAALDQIGVAEAPEGDLAVFLHVAQRTGLDPFSRQIYMIGRKDRETGRKKWTIQTAIDGFRIIAARHPQYAGQLEPQWCGDDGVWRDVWPGRKPPTAARVGVLRHDWPHPVYATVHFEEFAARSGGSLTPMWAGKGAHMIGKVAEAHALRKAFPQDLAGVYTDDEMAHVDHPPRRRAAVIEHDTVPVTAAELTGDTPGSVAADLPSDGGERMTQPQQRKLFALLRESEIEGREERFAYASGILGRPIESYGQLSVTDANRVIDKLDAIVTVTVTVPDAEPADTAQPHPTTAPTTETGA